MPDSNSSEEGYLDNESPEINQIINEEPLLVFSIYTNSQSKFIRKLGGELLQCLDTLIIETSDNGMLIRDGQKLSFVYDYFWLWTLGAFEIVRTMDRAQACFSQPLRQDLKHLKGSLSLLRTPFAKQEPSGDRDTAIYGDNSMYSFKHSPPDILFFTKGQEVSTRKLIEQFENVFKHIRRSDVLADHRSTYKKISAAPTSAPNK